MINKPLIPELNSDEPPRLEIRHCSFVARCETAIGATFPYLGGLIAYGPDGIDQYRRAAGYVDRVLKGEKPADLLVQAPTRPRSSSAWPCLHDRIRFHSCPLLAQSGH
jgi:hypothetical protein